MSERRSKIRCAVYTRKSHEEGLDQEFNSLDAQRQSCEAYIESQRHEGWSCLPGRYDDGGFSGGNMDRPALGRLIDDIQAGQIDCVVVYKVDRLSRSLLDFARLIALFDEHDVSFVSVTQQFNTTTSMGRLTLNILLSFAQFEREIIGERIRDKKLATARQGKYIGGQPKLGLDIVDRRYVVNRKEAELVRRIFEMFLQLQSCRKVADALNAEGIVTKTYTTKTGKTFGGKSWKRRTVYDLLTDQKYIGKIVHKGVAYDAEHPAIVDAAVFEKVQEVLRANKTYTHKQQAKRFALLRRMLTCGECGGRIMPSWCRNHGREYRYYACSKKVKTGYGKCPLPTLPAGEIEKLVVGHLRALFRHPDVIARTYREIQRLAECGPSEDVLERLEHLRGRQEQTQRAIRAILDLGQHDGGFMAEELKRLSGELKSLEREIRQLQHCSVDGGTIELNQVTDALQRIDPIWEVLHPEEQRRVLELLVEKITVSKDRIEIRFRSNGIERIVEELGPVGTSSAGGPVSGHEPSDDHRPPTVRHDGDAIVIRIPVRFCRRNGQQVVMAPGGAADNGRENGERNDALVTAIGKAYRWQEQLESREYSGLEDLAAANGVDRTYVGRILRLTSLAPEIVEAILEGNEPEGMSLAKLRAELPMVWRDQRWS